MTRSVSARAGSTLAFIPPCLARAIDAPPHGNDWIHEVKFDGYRIQAHLQGGRVRLLTRNGHDWTEKLGKVGDDLQTLSVRSAIIDGEAIVQDAAGVADFAALTSELKRGQSTRIVVMAFDLLHLDGADLRERPLLERKATLQRLLERTSMPDLLAYSDHITGAAAAILAKVCEIGAEGIVSKRADRPYRSGRGGDWVKVKCRIVDPFVIIGYVTNTAASEAVGSLVLGYYDGPSLVYAGRVGTGFSARIAAQLWHALQPLVTTAPPLARKLDREQRLGVNWVSPRLVARIEYRAWTDDKILRHATFQGLRGDKAARAIGHPSSQRVPG